MSEPTSALSTYDLVKEVALAAEIAYYGVSGNEEAMIPIDPSDLDRCLRVVNNAIRHFIAHGPAEGWRWRKRLMEVNLVRGYTGTASAGTATSLTDDSIAGTYDDDYFTGYVLTITAGTGKGESATVTGYDGTNGIFTFTALSGGSTPDSTSEYRICRSTQVIESDPSRYLLSQDFHGQVTGPITFATGQNASGINWTSEANIRRSREVSVNSSTFPFVAAVRPYSTNRRWELIVDPEPTDETTVVFPYLADFDKLTLIAGTASSGGETSLVDSSFAGHYPDDYFNGSTIRIISGTGKTSYATVIDFTGASCTFTVADWLYQDGTGGGTDPDVGSVYYVEPAASHPAGMQFDDVILSACRAHTEIEFTDVSRGFMQEYLQRDLPTAYLIDGHSVPRKLDVMGSGSGPRCQYIQRPIVKYTT